jgi:hypothetical protein
VLLQVEQAVLQGGIEKALGALEFFRDPMVEVELPARAFEPCLLISSES